VIAEELSHRAAPEQLKAEARELVDKAKTRAIEKKDELTAQAKEKAREKATEWKEQAMASPTAYAMLGGLTGAVAGALVGKKMKAQSEEEFVGGYYPPRMRSGQYGYVPAPYGYPPSGYPSQYGQEEGGTFDETRARAGEKVDEVKSRVGEKVEDVKASAGEKVEEVKQKAGEVASAVKEKAQAMTDRMPSMESMRTSGRRLLREDPWLIAIGALVIGSAAAFLLPLTESERKVFGQAQEAARRGVQKVKEAVEEKIAPEVEEEEISAEPYGSEQPPAIH
jgi:hypothetical protein